MKCRLTITLGCLLLVGLSGVGISFGQDMRTQQIEARQAREALLEKAAAEKEAAEKADAVSRQQILNDRSRLKAVIADIEKQNAILKNAVETLESESGELEAREKDISQKLAETDSVMRELVGAIRVNAKDIHGLIEQNLLSALGNGAEASILTDIGGQSQFPGMSDIETMATVLWEQIRNVGEVRLDRGPVIDRAGNSIEADLLLMGNFTAAYRSGDEIGFLSYSSAGRKLFALSQLPPRRLQKQLRSYMGGKGETVPLDISRGAALRQLTHQLSLWQQIPKGGPIVWPIVAILIVGIAIVIERIIFLMRRRVDSDHLARRIETLAVEEDWQGCREICNMHTGKPVGRVMAAGLACWHMQREAMENALQEAILKEVPPMERFLSTLGMLAAIAPLLGLLGTVTGMIDTFHVITQHGTGDPRMMSGGISEALVTTMLGLTVAIPIMLAHTLLNRAVDTRIGEMEEKAVALVNIVHKSRHASDHIN
jgi:biopolymer transport protein ExbB